MTTLPWELELEQAVALTINEEFSEAKILFNRLLEVSERDDRVLFEVGNLHAHEGTLDEAIESYRESLNKNSSNVDCLINLGNTLSYVGKDREGAHLLQKALKLAPDNSGVHFSLGNIYYGTGSLNRAIEHYRKATKLNPHNINAQCNLGCVLAEENQLEEAISAFEVVLREWPDDYEILINLGNIYYDLKEFEKSKNFYLRASSIKRCIDSLNNVGSCYLALGQMNEALTTFKESLVISEDNPNALNNVGYVYMKRGDYDSAVIFFERTLDYCPEYYEALINLGNVYNQCGQEEEAKGFYLEALTYNESSSVAHYNLGNIYHQQNNYDDAEKHYKTALKLSPKYVDAYCNLGGIYMINHSPLEAAELYLKALELNPDNDSLWYNLGNSYTMCREDEKAVEAYETVLSINPEHQAVRHVLATHRGEVTDSAPADYVKGLFDDYSSRFEDHLTSVLHYKTPSLLKKMCLSVYGDSQRFSSMVDLGCGTGLAGVEFSDMCDQMIGIDLSPKMLKQAEIKNIYSELHADGIESWMESTDQGFDLVVAADVFVYIGKLETLFAAVSAKATKHARFLFSVEFYDGEDFTLRKSGRYAHSDAYIRSLAQSVGAEIKHSEICGLRKENDEWIQGMLYALEF